MPARSGDAAAEDEDASAVVQQGLSGRLDAEAPRLGAVDVPQDGDPGNGGRAAPRLGLLPAALHGRGAQEEHVCFGWLRRSRQYFGELVEARVRTGALRMRDEQQRRTVCGRREGTPG